MSTLWKRANGSQHRMLKIVSGAVLNAAHAHPNAIPDRKFARSVAKRAVGTLTAQWPEVLAAEVTPLSGNAAPSLRARRDRRLNSKDGEGGASQLVNARPFSKLCARLGRQVKPLRFAGDYEERFYHDKFSKYRAHGEWFHYEGGLAEFVSGAWRKEIQSLPDGERGLDVIT